MQNTPGVGVGISGVDPHVVILPYSAPTMTEVRGVGVDALHTSLRLAHYGGFEMGWWLHLAKVVTCTCIRTYRSIHKLHALSIPHQVETSTHLVVRDCRLPPYI